MEGIVPEEVITRKVKIGYLAPDEYYRMKNEMKPFVSGIFSGQDFKNRDIYNQKLILSKYNNMLARKTGDEKLLLNILWLEIWFKSQGM